MGIGSATNANAYVKNNDFIWPALLASFVVRTLPRATIIRGVENGYLSRGQGSLLFAAVQISTICVFPQLAMPMFITGASLQCEIVAGKNTSSDGVRKLFFDVMTIALL